MANPVAGATQAAGAVANTAKNGIKSAFGLAFKHYGKLTAAVVAVAGAAIFMQPAVLATVSSNLATLPAATGFSGAVGNTISATGSTLWTGLSNSGPVWKAAWGGASALGTGAYEFATNIPGVK